MTKKLESITIHAELIGDIWMPDVECTKESTTVFTPEDRPFTSKWTGLRDALLQITNDGDFRSCVINWGIMVIRWWDGKYHIEKTVDIPNCKLTSDCLVTP